MKKDENYSKPAYKGEDGKDYILWGIFALIIVAILFDLIG